jgi:hypothetical protein
MFAPPFTVQRRLMRLLNRLLGGAALARLAMASAPAIANDNVLRIAPHSNLGFLHAIRTADVSRNDD